MVDETATGPAGAFDSGGHPPGGGGDSPPLQARAAFVKNWEWQSIVSINRGACQRGGAQHGANPETASACAQEWETLRGQSLTLAETLDRLRGFHRKAPFLFFNGKVVWKADGSGAELTATPAGLLRVKPARPPGGA